MKLERPADSGGELENVVSHSVFEQLHETRVLVILRDFFPSSYADFLL